MELIIASVYIHLILILTSIRVSTTESQCSNLQTGSKPERCLDHCNIMTLLEGMEKFHKGIQLQTQSQLADLDTKMTNILNRIDPCSSSPCVHGKCSKTEDDFVCTCDAGYTGKKCNKQVTVTDCHDLRQKVNETRDGVYKIQLWKSKEYIEVFCDMTTDGGGWTVFQRRMDGSVDFYRDFIEYKDGFGDVYEEYWLGLQYIQELASQDSTEMRLDLTSADDSHVYETYSDFRLSPTSEYYLHLSRGISSSENAAFRMMLYNGFAFTTKDRDFDLETATKDSKEEDTNCGSENHGGWWYGYCKDNHFVNLNGEYCNPGKVSAYNGGYGGMFHRDFKGLECLKSSKMMLRRRD